MERHHHDELVELRQVVPRAARNHTLGLASAMVEVMGHEPDFTNYREGWHGCLDYLFYETAKLATGAVLSPIPLTHALDDFCGADGLGGPNKYQPSDHLVVMADFFFHS